MKIVDATIEDASVIGEIQTQTWLCNYPNPKMGITKEDIEEKTRLWSQQGNERIVKLIQKPNTHTWVAKDGNKVVGFIGIKKTDKANIIDALHVLPNYQNQGIGTQLLKIALDWLRDDKKITIEVVTYNEGAKRLYKKFGFKEVGKTHDDPITLPSGKIIPKILMVKAFINPKKRVLSVYENQSRD
jgi:ribosomal protein S18 acetylase RimI-like enzyme